MSLLNNKNKNISIYKFIKFLIVGGIGAIITWSLTWIFTEKVHLWYMLSLIISTCIAAISNYTMNSIWTFSNGKSMSDCDYEWNAYYKGNIIQKWWKHKILSYVTEMCSPVKQDQNMIDYGCGSNPLGVQVICNYIGVDSNQDKVNFMNKKVNGTSAIYLQGGISKLQSFNDNYFDNVICSEVIEHMDTKEQSEVLLKELRRVLKVDGNLIIATPDYKTITWRLVEFMYSILMPESYADDHKVKFTEYDLIWLCDKNGLVWQDTKRVAGCDLVCKFVKNGLTI